MAIRGSCQLVVFDLAGTTVKDDGQVAVALERALAEQGIALAPDAVLAVRGTSKREAVRRLIPQGPDHERLAEAAYRAFVAYLTSAYRTHGVAPVAGARGVFEELRAHGIRVALNTGFDRAVTDLLLDALRWRHDTVDVVVCGDDVAHGRPAPDLILRAMAKTGAVDARAVANVGDTTTDLEAGQRAGVGWNVAVLSGAHDRARLETAPHTHIIASVAALPALIVTDSTRL